MSKKPEKAKKDMREAYLFVNSGGSGTTAVAGLVACFFVAAGLMGYLDEMMRSAFSPGGSLLAKLQLIAGATATVSILMAVILKFFRRTPKKFRVQTFRNPERLLYNLACCALVCVGLFGGLRAIQEKDTRNRVRWEQMEAQQTNPESISKARTKDVVFSWLLGLPLVLGCGAVLWWSGGILLSEARTYWRHVRLTAYFDRERYAPGEEVTMMLKDRQSFGSKRAYRLHVNYVREKNIQSGKSAPLARSLYHYRTWPVTAGQLHDGFRFSLPASINTEKYLTNLGAKPYPCYWEVLIEEAGSHFYCRFFVNV